MENLVKTINYKEFKISVYQDTFCDSPDCWGNEEAFVVYDHRDFRVKVKGFDSEDIFDTITQSKNYFYEGYFVFPLYAYIHSGVALSLGKTQYPFNCKFDTSYRGFVLVKREKGCWTREKAKTYAESIVEEWNDYLRGNVYGYVITDKYGNDLDSCWGFYGDYNKNLIPECENIINNELTNNSEKYATQLELFGEEVFA